MSGTKGLRERGIGERGRAASRMPSGGAARALVVVALLGCGSATPPPPPRSSDAPQRASSPSSAIATIDAEIGGLDEAAVQETFAKSGPAIGACIERGAERLSFLEGELKVTMRIDSQGRALEVIPTHSTYGDRATEKCIVEVLSQKRWPRPVGGRTGLATHALDSRAIGKAATALAPHKLGPALDKLKTGLAQCTRSGVAVTFYLDADGKPLAAGASTKDATGLPALDCAVSTTLGIEYPAPPSAPAKVTLAL